MTTRIVLMAIGLAGLLAATPAFAQTPVGGSNGQTLYSSYCAFCHGPGGRGDGPIASTLKTRPADLTRIAARRKGQFPSDEVTRIIDGRKSLRAHGNDMPVWGDALAKSFDTMPLDEKIKRLVVYLESIQARAE